MRFALLSCSCTLAGGPRVSFSGHFFQPLQFDDDGSVQDLNCDAGFQSEVSLTLGDGISDSGALTTATDSSPRFADVSSCPETSSYVPFETLETLFFQTSRLGEKSKAENLTDVFGLQYHVVCDTDRFSRVIQTWTNSKTGILSSVAVNLAAGNQSTDVLVTVFRFSNLTALVSPE